MLPDLMHDLFAFRDDDSLPAVSQAAIAHAQFETVHPFAGGYSRSRLPPSGVGSFFRHGRIEQHDPVHADRLGPDADRQRSRSGPQRHHAVVHDPPRARLDVRGAFDVEEARGRPLGLLRRRRAHGSVRCAWFELAQPRPARRPGSGRLLRACRHLRAPVQGDAAAGDGNGAAERIDAPDDSAGARGRPSMDAGRADLADMEAPCSYWPWSARPSPT